VLLRAGSPLSSLAARVPLRSALAIWSAVWLLLAAPGTRADPRDAGLGPNQATVLRVGAMRTLKRPSEAAQIAGEGAVIEIDAGTYIGDTAIWRQDGLTIRGVGGHAHLRAEGANAEGKGTWVIKGSNVIVERLEFSGAKVPDRNGAGIRFEGAGLTVRDCYFHDNENSILARADESSDIVIERSEFARNGFGDGQSHNLYIGGVRSLTLRFSYLHHAVVGHNVKSRAVRSHIAYNRIMDEHDGRSSYAIEFPEGGLAFVIGNIVQQGPATENPTIISYGAEGLRHATNEIYLVNNTMVNDRPGGGRFLFIRGGADGARVLNNVFVGRGEPPKGLRELHQNIFVREGDLVHPSTFDYRLKAGSVAIDRAVDPGSAYGVRLLPTEEYEHKARGRRRADDGALDAGALEFRRPR